MNRSDQLTPSEGRSEGVIHQMMSWFSNLMGPAISTERLQQVTGEQEESQKAFLELLNRNPADAGVLTASAYVVYLQRKVSEYEQAFSARYREFGDMDNVLGQEHASFKTQYVTFKSDINKASAYLKALETPGALLDALSKEALSSDIKKKAHAFFRLAAPDRNQNKGTLVAKLSHVMMIFMGSYKSKLLNTNDGDDDKLGLNPLYERYNVLYHEVLQLRATAFQIAADRRNDIPYLGIVPVFDEKRVTDLDAEFNRHVYKKLDEEKALSRKEAFDLTGCFSYYCYCLQMNGRYSCQIIGECAKTAAANARVAEDRAAIAEDRAAIAESRAASQQMIDAFVTDYSQAIAEGKLSADEPSYLKLLNIQKEKNYLKASGIINECCNLFVERKVTNLPNIFALNAIAKAPTQESHQEAEISNAPDNGTVSNAGTAQGMYSSSHADVQWGSDKGEGSERSSKSSLEAII